MDLSKALTLLQVLEQVQKNPKFQAIGAEAHRQLEEIEAELKAKPHTTAAEKPAPRVISQAKVPTPPAGSETDPGSDVRRV